MEKITIKQERLCNINAIQFFNQEQKLITIYLHHGELNIQNEHPQELEKMINLILKNKGIEIKRGWSIQVGNITEEFIPKFILMYRNFNVKNTTL
ncbi:MAG: hypothetical protein LW807_06735 [Proteobacteria bacterium]|nr:hypothetical protein [Pseudomonadota bacterium]